MAGINYWVWKDSEIQAELEKYKLSVEPFNRKEAIKSLKMEEAKTTKQIYVEPEEDGDDDVKAQGIASLKKEVPNLMLQRVIFHNTTENDLPFIFVGHNGRSFYLPRETEIDVPTYILNSCIKDAVEDRLVQVVLQNGDIEWKVRKIQRFPYTIVKGPFPAP